ncbi:putative acyl-CoA thioester hydrolase [BD1-7 clade bacterium]|uniref:Putative acyl-CoA thioester hydrolase n=1 Tax=BD1-7 clade bacterium TaxID=2029982 RepID=A0A5S9MQU4_9GAMM|nr:putative acyl-CoA thioester hydrolase [BD1-7 clade bacterium]CAA0084622.1 putative acyl-CoA thioester hydrolase [BD1-7 clade bacterium]
MISELDSTPAPMGELTLQTVAMPKDTNASGDIFGGWLVSQMDIAGAIAASRIANGRVATVAIDNMSFMIPVKVGSVVSCYTYVENVGTSSVQIQIEVWMALPNDGEPQKVTEGLFVFVALDSQGKTRSIDG